MPIKTSKTEKKVAVKKSSKRDAVTLVIKEKFGPDEYDIAEGLVPELVVPVVPDEEGLAPVVSAEPLCSSLQGEEVSAELVSSSDEELLEKPKKTRVLKEGKPLVNETGEYLNPLTNRYVKVGTTLYKKLIKDGMICVIPV